MKKVALTIEDNRDRLRLSLSVPMAFKKNGSRKKIILPGGPGKSVASDPTLQRPLLLALARAHRWRRLLEQDRFVTVTELAAALGVDSSYVGRILRLTLLAPDIIEAILVGKEPSGLSLERLTKTLPIDWIIQKKELLSGDVK